MKDKELQLKILEQLMGEMDDYEFEKKLKPKVMAIKIEKTSGLKDLKEVLGGDCSCEEEAEEEVTEQPNMSDVMDESEEEGDELGARFKKLFKK